MNEFQENSAGGGIPNGMPVTKNSTKATPSGSSLAVGILPTYSTLPPNVGHFAFGQQATCTPVAKAAINFVCFSTIVPDGRVIQAQQFRVNVVDTFDAGGVSTGVPKQLLTLALFVNGVSEPYNQNIISQPFDGFYPCTIVAAPKNIIEIKVTFDYSAVAAAINTVLFKTDLTGDMLFQNNAQTENTALRLPTLPIGGV